MNLLYRVTWRDLAVMVGSVLVCGVITLFSLPHAPAPATAAQERSQDSTFVARIKEFSREGWIWTDNPHLREIARDVYARSAP